jgi:flavin reductase (DIM6/NTAB) family NADH-FMN oxidoreductase RutF
MAVEPDLLRNAMRFWGTGITIVTSAHNNVAHGMTVSSFTSLSLTPPQVLVSLARNTRTHDLITKSHAFGVTVLGADQQEISDRFAGRVADELDRLAGIETINLATGVPLIKDGIAHFDCIVKTTIGSGTHTIFIGEVLATRTAPDDAEPLLYYNRAYRLLEK